jgi:hypothetical protein
MNPLCHIRFLVISLLFSVVTTNYAFGQEFSGWDTNFKKKSINLSELKSGGPPKDGIPSIDNPVFISQNDASEWIESSEPIIAFTHQGAARAYPLQVLIWHEIVNDTIGDNPIAVTFCPLCGSAVVYSRALPQGVTTFGVSGALIESNMVMYDRDTESLFQQSTGKGIAGTYHGLDLEHEKFQLLTVSEVREKYPHAQVLSTDTGYSRNYLRNPYSGYDESDDFIFGPSALDARYPSKMIFVAFSLETVPVAVPWLELEDGKVYTFKVEGNGVTLTKEGDELTVTNVRTKDEIPFYFEMWFSWAVQHKDGVVLEPEAGMYI